MTSHIRTQDTLVAVSSADFAEGYEKGQVFFLSGEALREPDEEYLLSNLIALYEDGAFQNANLLRWHVGFLLGMVSGKFIPES